jgi:hypothetical protein
MLSAKLVEFVIGLGVVCILAAVTAVAIKTPLADIGTIAGKAERGGVGVLGVALIAWGIWNPGEKHFAITRISVYAAPASYRGVCPLSVYLVGRVEAKNGAGQVASDLHMSFGADMVTEPRMASGESRERIVTVRASASGYAVFTTYAPDRLEVTTPVHYRCSRSKPRRSRRALSGGGLVSGGL